MSEQADWDALLRRVDALARDLARLRRDVLRAMTGTASVPTRKPTLYGSVEAGDVTDEMIDAARRELLRPLADV